MSSKKKITVTESLLANGLASSESEIEGLVLAGKVRVNGEKVSSPKLRIPENAAIEVSASKKYVSRGGLKLNHALDHFKISPGGKVCADVGSSTGGFTQVLLERGASKVYAIDVGYGELEWKLRNDPRVKLMERTNARTLEKLPEKVQLVTMDLSFISVTMVLPNVRSWLESGAELVILLKPQFEARRDEVPDGGVIVDQELHLAIISRFKEWAAGNYFEILEQATSPITGGDGNTEFFFLMRST